MNWKGIETAVLGPSIPTTRTHLPLGGFLFVCSFFGAFKVIVHTFCLRMEAFVMTERWLILLFFAEKKKLFFLSFTFSLFCSYVQAPTASGSSRFSFFLLSLLQFTSLYDSNLSSMLPKWPICRALSWGQKKEEATAEGTGQEEVDEKGGYDASPTAPQEQRP